MNCSASRFVRRGIGIVATLIAIAAGPFAFGASIAEFDDAQARLQYGFLTADARAIQSVLQEIEGYTADGSLAALRAYQLAYGNWKLAQIYAQDSGAGRTASLSAKAAKSCAEHARAARNADPRMAEAFALEAVCEGMPRGFLRLIGLTGSCARHKQLRTALSLEPSNPRVLLIEAVCAGNKDSVADTARWRKVVDAFTRSPPASAGKPDWGEPEAWVLLGEAHLQRGEGIQAREALERALVLAPDYTVARTLLDTLATRAQ